MVGPHPQTPIAPLPSILALGHRLAAVEKAYDDADTSKAEGLDLLGRHAAMKILGDQSDALRALISTIPAKTLSDAAVQAHVAAVYAAMLHGSHLTEYQTGHYSGMVERMLYSIAVVVTRAAGLDAAAMAFESDFTLCEGRFQGLDRAGWEGGA